MTESKVEEEEESSDLSKTNEEDEDEDEEEREHRNARETWKLATSETAITTTVTDLTVPSSSSPMKQTS